MKTCIKCGERKPLSAFYKHPKMADGHLNECKVCSIEYERYRRRTNPAVQAYDRSRARRPQNARPWREGNPKAYKAHEAVSYAVQTGRLTKGSCEVCGTTENIHAHHDDYTKPLSVRWLCALHHARLHADQRSLQR